MLGNSIEGSHPIAANEKQKRVECCYTLIYCYSSPSIYRLTVRGHRIQSACHDRPLEAVKTRYTITGFLLCWLIMLQI